MFLDDGFQTTPSMKAHILNNTQSGSWNRYYLEQAVGRLKQKMQDNEEWLLRAMLGLNEDAVVFEEVRPKKQLGGKNRDNLYLFMTEKDVQTALAAELYQNDRCHVHVEVPIYGKTNRRKYKKAKPYNFRPDLLLLSTRRKATLRRRESHLEVTAVEIKYFEKYQKPWIKQMIKWDVSKLHQYFRRVSPKVDSGFFLCVDETGCAKDYLQRTFSQSWMKDKHIGCFVLVPKYVSDHRDYPMHLQALHSGMERATAYVMDKALGMLKQWCPASFESESLKWEHPDRHGRSAGPWFYIRAGKKHVGSAYLDWQFKNGRKIKPALIIHVTKKYRHVGNPNSVRWDNDLQTYRRCQDRELSNRVYCCTSRMFRYSLKNMDTLAMQLFKNIKKVSSRARA
jgi:hypothetical protein